MFSRLSILIFKHKLRIRVIWDRVSHPRMSQYARANNLAHGLGCVKGKPEDDFKEMIFSLDFLLLFSLRKKVRQSKQLSAHTKPTRFSFRKQQNPLYPNYAIA